MANDQLVRYIKDQLKAGTGKDAVKNVLLGAGWSQVDVNEAFTFAEGMGVAPVATAPAASPSQSTPGLSSPSLSYSAPRQSVSPLGAQSGAGSSAPLGGTNAGGMPKGPIVIDAPMEEKKEDPVMPVTVAVGVASQSKPGAQPAQSPRMMSVSEAAKMTTIAASQAKNDASRGGKKLLITTIILGIVSLLLLGGFVYEFVSVGGKMKIVNSQNADLTAQLGSVQGEFQKAQARSAELDASIAALTGQKEELLTELSFRVKVPSLVEASESRTVTVRGKVEIAQGGAYTLRTAHGVVVTLGNANIQKVHDALLPIVGQDAEVTGSYTVGTNILTVTAVNGASTVEIPPAAAAL